MSPAEASAQRARGLLARPGAWLDRTGETWLVRVAADRRRRPVLRLDREAMLRLKREPGLLPRGAGGWVLAGAAGEVAPGRLVEQVGEAMVDGRRTPVLANRGESPIAWLARRKGPDGRPWLSPAEVMAAERLREDFERAGVVGRLTMDWEAGPRDRQALGPAAAPKGGAARRRVQAALEAVGPGLREMLEEVCLGGSALQAAERALGLPARSGRIRLTLALQRLARHYRLA
ncbi:DUF6456 domain-containing protein [Brevundimonas sp.]|uniref:DUF6456 domain-containing protein n=1 Tax=Brevundimonas sp. TaxID=1871086 RepID=UPI0025CEC6B2|nr:DUF6456 domain-containing protein [Brevundimonas sp.]